MQFYAAGYGVLVDLIAFDNEISFLMLYFSSGELKKVTDDLYGVYPVKLQ